MIYIIKLSHSRHLEVNQNQLEILPNGGCPITLKWVRTLYSFSIEEGTKNQSKGAR